MGYKELIRTIYLYLFSLVGLVLVVIGSVRLVDLGLKAFIFTRADQVLIYPVYPKAQFPESDNTQQPSLEEIEKFQQEQEKYEKESKQSQRERTAAESLAMIIVGAPLFLYHWRLIQKGSNFERTPG